jgi:hypothetical protein
VGGMWTLHKKKKNIYIYIYREEREREREREKLSSAKKLPPKGNTV